MFQTVSFRTVKNDVVCLTDSIREIVRETGVEDGICVIYCTHTTAGLITTSFGDPKGHEDIQDELRKLIPTRVDFKHQHDTPEDAAGHVKSALVGSSITLFVENGELFIGNTKGVYFIEFDGPRERKVMVKVLKAA
ncbi:MAG: YjbQ family protein [Lachnospiraceae bacterium]|jgi:secondary thiamine-phosphate synthase enzyme|nr:YjbQ family protein [Lachnospiraceae bacterium]